MEEYKKKKYSFGIKSCFMVFGFSLYITKCKIISIENPVSIMHLKLKKSTPVKCLLYVKEAEVKQNRHRIWTDVVFI